MEVIVNRKVDGRNLEKITPQMDVLSETVDDLTEVPMPKFWFDEITNLGCYSVERSWGDEETRGAN